MNWTETKEAVQAQLSRDPQRATLSLKAIAGVEDGLRHLASVGYSFELAPTGLVRELRQGADAMNSRTLSIAEAVNHVVPSSVESGGSEIFDAD